MPKNSNIYAGWAKTLVDIAKKAGDAILTYYKEDIAVTLKDDNSPLTQADLAAHHIIVDALCALSPDIPIVSEENETATNSGTVGERFWLVDPLDGTKSFIKRTGEFTVNIALIEEGAPVLGVVYLPVKGEMFFTGDDGKAYSQIFNGAPPRKIQVRKPPAEGMVVVASHSHRNPETDAYIHKLKVKELISVASSLKFCVIAAGEADLYPRLGPTMEWDTAAAHAVLNAAGGSVSTLEGAPLMYGKPEFKNSYFIARGHKL